MAEPEELGEVAADKRLMRQSVEFADSWEPDSCVPTRVLVGSEEPSADALMKSVPGIRPPSEDELIDPTLW